MRSVGLFLPLSSMRTSLAQSLPSPTRVMMRVISVVGKLLFPQRPVVRGLCLFYWTHECFSAAFGATMQTPP
jgi:hypothetical protein